MKIDPYKYPVVIISAFVIGMLIAFAFGFRPQHGSTDRSGQGQFPPVMVQNTLFWEFPIT
ncbi:MAG: hypothetical protein ABIJ65_00310 [Chloroflexota bacterium]